MKYRWALNKFRFVAFAVVITLILGVVVMQLWNALIPELFHGPLLSFWQATGILVLSHLLLRGWGRGRYGNGWQHDRWRRRWDAKWAAMTPEEREKSKAEWKHRCGGYPGESEETKGQTQA